MVKHDIKETPRRHGICQLKERNINYVWADWNPRT